MVAFWWLVVVFFAGGLAGTLLVALLHMAADEPEQSSRVPNLNSTPW